MIELIHADKKINTCHCFSHVGKFLTSQFDLESYSKYVTYANNNKKTSVFQLFVQNISYEMLSSKSAKS